LLHINDNLAQIIIKNNPKLLLSLNTTLKIYMKLLTPEQLLDIVAKYTSGTSLSDLSKTFDRSEATLKTNIKKYVAGLIINKEITIEDASVKYKFSIPDLQKSVDFKKCAKSDVQNDVQSDVKSDEIVKDEQSSDTSILEKINVNLKVIFEEIKGLKNLVFQKDKQIETHVEIIQKLIHARNPDQLVQEIREERKQNGTSYVEPIRPPDLKKPVNILYHDEFYHKVRGDFQYKDLLKGMAGSRWFDGGGDKSLNGWLIPISNIGILEKKLMEGGIIFNRYLEKPEVINEDVEESVITIDDGVKMDSIFI
jgi:predicted DNA-binding protein YlxM (UPF0122 family)